ncbi:Telomerase-binding protein EST1A [Apiospora aurea]|uniref:Telomerase-binding protein EST1A n=1 Tax=Apiospora aurea TaxID=335848 RepID=A0ABR1PSY6_9PEZI
MTLFNPDSRHPRLLPIDFAFVKAHGLLFAGETGTGSEYDITVAEFIGELDNHISRTTQRWMNFGCCIAISNCCDLLSLGQDSFIYQTIRPKGPKESQEHACYYGTRPFDQQCPTMIEPSSSNMESNEQIAIKATIFSLFIAGPSWAAGIRSRAACYRPQGRSSTDSGWFGNGPGFFMALFRNQSDTESAFVDIPSTIK